MDKRDSPEAVYKDEVTAFRLPDNSSILSAELKGIELALDHIEVDGYILNVIFTDFLSSVQALENESFENMLIVPLLEKVYRICSDTEVIFSSLPCHKDLQGNERAGAAAKPPITKDMVFYTIHYSDYKL